MIGIAALMQDSTETQKPSQIMTAMLAHYDSAKSISGQITLTQTAQNTKIVIKTFLQFDKPSMIVITQDSPQLGDSPATERFLNSNGKTFHYTKADYVIGPDVIQEYVTQNGVQQDIRALYSAVRPSLKDPNALLECAIGRKADLQALLAQWTSLQSGGKVQLDGRSVNLITGSYRTDSSKPITGSFQAYIDDSSNFLRYVLTQKIGVPQQDTVISVVSDWTSTLHVDAKTNPEIYRG